MPISLMRRSMWGVGGGAGGVRQGYSYSSTLYWYCMRRVWLVYYFIVGRHCNCVCQLRYSVHFLRHVKSPYTWHIQILAMFVATICFNFHRSEWKRITTNVKITSGFINHLFCCSTSSSGFVLKLRSKPLLLLHFVAPIYRFTLANASTRWFPLFWPIVDQEEILFV